MRNILFNSILSKFGTNPQDADLEDIMYNMNNVFNSNVECGKRRKSSIAKGRI